MELQEKLNNLGQKLTTMATEQQADIVVMLNNILTVYRFLVKHNLGSALGLHHLVYFTLNKRFILTQHQGQLGFYQGSWDSEGFAKGALTYYPPEALANLIVQVKIMDLKDLVEFHNVWMVVANRAQSYLYAQREKHSAAMAKLAPMVNLEEGL